MLVGVRFLLSIRKMFPLRRQNTSLETIFNGTVTGDNCHGHGVRLSQQLWRVPSSAGVNIFECGDIYYTACMLVNESILTSKSLFGDPVISQGCFETDVS